MQAVTKDHLFCKGPPSASHSRLPFTLLAVLTLVPKIRCPPPHSRLQEPTVSQDTHKLKAFRLGQLLYVRGAWLPEAASILGRV